MKVVPALLKCSVMVIPSSPGLKVGDTLVSLAFLITIRMVGSQKYREEVAVLNQEKQGGHNFMSSEVGGAARTA